MFFLLTRQIEFDFFLTSLTRFRNYIALIFGLPGLIYLAGCTPIWPSMVHDRNLRLVSGDNLQCHMTTSLPNAYSCLTAAKEEMETALIHIGEYHRSFGYTAVAGGTVAGFQAVKTNPSVAPLKNIGVGLAALVGFDKVVDADTQVVAFTAGLKALACIDAAAQAAQASKASLQAAQGNMGVYSAAFVTANRANDMATAMFKTLAITDANTQALVTHQITGSVAIQKSSVDQLATAILDATDDKVLANKIRNGVSSVRNKVLAQIANHSVDIEKIFKDQQERVKQIVGDIVGKGQAALAAQRNVAALAAVLGQSTPAVENPTKPVTDVYEECVAPLNDPK